MCAVAVLEETQLQWKTKDILLSNILCGTYIVACGQEDTQLSLSHLIRSREVLYNKWHSVGWNFSFHFLKLVFSAPTGRLNLPAKDSTALLSSPSLFDIIIQWPSKDGGKKEICC